MKILVCGGRKFANQELLFRVLDNINLELGPITLLIQGGALGADRLAFRWARLNHIPCIEYKADWYTYGNAAGPIRNQRMLDEQKPDLVVAFPGNKGTRDMVNKARQAEVKIKEIMNE